MSEKDKLMKGALILSAAGLLCRGAGFLFRIFLSRAFKEEGVGIYQLIFPLYSLSFAFCASGVKIAVSGAAAKRSVLKSGDEAGRILFCGLCFSAALSFICFFFLQKNAGAIASGFLGDIRCEPLIKVMAYAIPFGAAHSCLTGYCYGRQEVNIPAFSQLIEESAKILFVFVTFYILKAFQKNAPTIILSAGLAAGEFCSAAYTFYCLNKKEGPLFRLKAGRKEYLLYMKELLSISVPVSCSRILVAFLQSVEAVSIPSRLRMYGMDAAASVKAYGVLSGMALPCIFLPAVLTNSLSSLLMPAVAKIHASQNKPALKEMIKKFTFPCFGLGIICCLFFRIAGRFIGSFLFHSALTGEFIVSMSWICPFFYINTTLTGIINGLGRASAAFFINAAGLAIRILNVFFVIPKMGINGYFTGLLSSQLAASALLVYVIARILNQKAAS